MNAIKVPEHIKRIINTLNENGYEAYAVGGCIRDSLLGRTPHDWDVTTSAKPKETKRLFKRTVDTGIEHGTVTVLTDGDAVEITTYRIDGEYKDSRHPSSVMYTSDIREDLRRRDFTINAIAYNDRVGLVDPFNGRVDLENRLIRCVGDPMDRLSEDALRIFRAIRFSAQLGFTIDENTKDAIKALTSSLMNISVERIASELVKTITSPHPEAMIAAYDMGITKVVLPEFDDMMECAQHSLHHIYTVGMHTVKTMENIPADRLLRLTMLFHDIGKPVVKATDANGTDHFKNHGEYSVKMAYSIMKRLRFDNDTIRKVTTLIKYHDWRQEPTQANVRRLVSVLGPALMEDFFYVQLADLAGQSDYQHDAKLKRINDSKEAYRQVMERGDCIDIGSLAITGHDIIALGIEKGPKVGMILNKALDDVLADPRHNTPEYLKDLVKRFL